LDQLINFSKYQAAGNDFVMIDARKQDYNWLKASDIAFLCHRNLGIGGDGLILLDYEEGYDFRMRYWNADGSFASFCGNGGRATVAFAESLGVAKQGVIYRFIAGDGEHNGQVVSSNWLQISMKDVLDYEWIGKDLFLNTGVPHLVHWLKEEELDLKSIGSQLRHEARFMPEGTNVTFIRSEGTVLHTDTFERGVEDVTMACGTGIVASVLASAIGQGLNFAEKYEQEVATGAGMRLKVCFKLTSKGFTDIQLIGPAREVFNGSIYLSGS